MGIKNLLKKIGLTVLNGGFGFTSGGFLGAISGAIGSSLVNSAASADYSVSEVTAASALGSGIVLGTTAVIASTLTCCSKTEDFDNITYDEFFLLAPCFFVPYALGQAIAGIIGSSLLYYNDTDNADNAAISQIVGSPFSLFFAIALMTFYFKSPLEFTLKTFRDPNNNIFQTTADKSLPEPVPVQSLGTSFKP